MDINKFGLEFICNNKIVKMNESTEIKIMTIEGLEASQYTINKVSGNQDGSSVTSRRIEPREIIITGDIEKNKNEDLNRKKLISFFNPKFDGILKVTRNNDKKKISYVVSSFQFKNKNMNDYQNFELIIECVNPYFESIDNFGKNIASITKQFAFPLVITQKGKIMGYKTFNNNVSLLNDGDLDTGVEIKIKALKSVNNPMITLNDKFIRINVNMLSNDILVINTNQRHKSITLNGNNIIQKIDRQSTFFNLEVGDNKMTYSSTEGYENMEVNVYFYKKYLGM